MADATGDDESEVGILKSNDIGPSEFRRLQREEFATEIEQVQYDEDSAFTYEGQILFRERRPYPGVPLQTRAILSSKYRPVIINTAHEGVGHMAATKTMKRVLEQFVWPGMHKDVRAYVKKCAACEAYHRIPVHVEMLEVEISPTPMQLVGVDLIGPFTPDEFGRRYLFTVMDYLINYQGGRKQSP